MVVPRVSNRRRSLLALIVAGVAATFMVPAFPAGAQEGVPDEVVLTVDVAAVLEGGVIGVTATREQPTGGPLDITVAAVDLGGGISPVIELAQQTVSWGDGVGGPVPLTFAVIDNLDLEDDRSVMFSASGPAGVASSEVVTVSDDGDAGTASGASISPGSVMEGVPTPASLVVTRSGGSEADLIVPLVADTDLAGVPAEIVIPAGLTRFGANFSLTVADDGTTTDGRTSRIRVGDGVVSVPVTVVEEGETFDVAVDTTTLVEGDAVPATVTITRIDPTPLIASLSLTLSPANEAALSSRTITFGPNEGGSKQVQLVALDDLDAEPPTDVVVLVDLDIAGTPTRVAQSSPVTVVDDPGESSITSFSLTGATEIVEGASIDVLARFGRSGSNESPLTVDVVAPPGLAVTPNRFVIQRGVNTLADVDLTITADDNELDDGDRLVQIFAGEAAADIVIVDNDVEMFTVSGPPALDEGDSTDIVISRLLPSNQAVDVELSVVGTGQDRVAIVGVPTVSFGAGNGGQAIVSLAYPPDDVDDEIAGVVIIARIDGQIVAQSDPIGLRDDDRERLRVSAPTRVREGDTFQVVVTRLSPKPGRIAYPITATGGSGFDLATDVRLPSEVVFANGEPTQSIVVEVVDDGRDENDETFAIGIGEVSTADITIVDDDVESYTLTGTTTDLPEGGQVALTLERLSATATDVEVNISAVGSGSGLVRLLGTVPVVFTSGGPTTAPVIVTYDQDLIDDDNTTIVIVGEIGGVEVARSDVLDLIDDDTESLTVSAPASIDEGATAVVTVTRSSPRRGERAYPITIVAGAGVGDADVEIANEVVFPDGATVASFEVAAIDDDADEPDETFQILVGGAPSDPITIVDTDVESFRLFSLRTDIDEGGGLDIFIDRNSPSPEPVTVTLAFQGAGANLVQFRDGAAVSFDAGVGGRKSIRLAYPEDGFDDDDPTVLVQASLGDEIVARSASLTLLDNDTEVVSFVTFPERVVEGDSFDVVIERRSPTRGPSRPYPLRALRAPNTVGFQTNDLDNPPAEFSFAAGATTAVITIATRDDIVDENTESFVLRSDGAETRPIEILDNDDERLAPVGAVGPVPEGGSVVVELRRIDPSDQLFTVDIVPADADALSVDRSQVRWAPFEIDVRTFTVTVADDRVEESGEQQNLLLFVNGDISPVVVPIPVLDDDDAGSVVPTASAFTVHASATTAEVSVRRQAGANGRFDGDVSVGVAGNGASETVSWDNGQQGVRRVVLDLPQGPGSTPLQYQLVAPTGGLDVAVPGFVVAFDPNDAPIGVDDTGIVAPGSTVTLNVLANDRDPDLIAGVPGAPLLSIVPTSNSGVGTVRGGRFVCTIDECSYTSSPGFIGNDTFTYTVTDGLASDTATVVICVGPEAVCGESDDFLLIGPFRAGLPANTVYLQTLSAQRNGIFDQGGGSDGAEIHLNAISDTVSILDSGSGADDVDTTTVVAGSGPDDILVTGSVVLSGPKSVRFDGMEILNVDAGAGDDTIEIAPGAGFRAAANDILLTVSGGDGSDQITVTSPDAAVEVDEVRGIVTVAGLGPIILESIEEILVSDPTGVRSITLSGYWMVAADGTVYEFGSAVPLPAAPVSGEAIDIDATADGFGAWVLDSTGDVHALGSARTLSDPRSTSTVLRAGEAYVSLAPTTSGDGYWVFTSAGRAIPFGDALFYGDLRDVPLNGPVLDAVPTASGLGYWMLGSDGGVFAFGDAEFFGSLPGIGVVPNLPTVGLVPDPDGVGYWFVASDGGVFAFEAGFRGSMGGIPLNRPVNGMIPFGNGYVLVADDGGAFVFSDLPFVGSLGGQVISSPIVGLSALTPP